MLVSKNALPLIDFVAVEDESRREGTTELAQVLHSAPATFVAAHFKGFLPGDANLDVVAFFQFQRLDHRSGQSNRQAVSPLRNLHRLSLDIHLDCISKTGFAPS